MWFLLRTQKHMPMQARNFKNKWVVQLLKPLRFLCIQSFTYGAIGSISCMNSLANATMLQVSSVLHKPVIDVPWWLTTLKSKPIDSQTKSKSRGAQKHQWTSRKYNCGKIHTGLCGECAVRFPGEACKAVRDFLGDSGRGEGTSMIKLWRLHT